VLKKLVAIILLLVAALLSFTACSNDAERGGVIATVGGQKVYKDEMDYFFNITKAEYENMGFDFMDESSETTQYIYSYLEKDSYDQALFVGLVKRLAKDKGFSVSEDEVQEYIDYYFPEDTSLNEFLQSYNITETAVRSIIEASKMSLLLYNDVTASLNLSDEELQSRYEADPSLYDKIQVSHILILAGEDATEEEKAAALAKVEDVIKQLNEGADFAELAKTYSEDTSSAVNGGLIEDYFTEGYTGYVEGYVAGAYELENIGDFSQTPVQTSYGYHIIKLNDRITGWENLKDDIMEADSELVEQKDTMYSQYLTEQEEDLKIVQKYEFVYYEEATEDNTDTEGTTGTEDSGNEQNE